MANAVITSFPTDEDRLLWAKAQQKINEEIKQKAESNQKVLEFARSNLTEDAFTELQITLKESYVDDFAIVDKPIGTKQDDNALWGMTYVNQTGGGGISGDAFSGTLSIPLQNGLYLQFSYST